MDYELAPTDREKAPLILKSSLTWYLRISKALAYKRYFRPLQAWWKSRFPLPVPSLMQGKNLKSRWNSYSCLILACYSITKACFPPLSSCYKKETVASKRLWKNRGKNMLKQNARFLCLRLMISLVLGGYICFLAIDLDSRYWQVGLSPEDCNKCVLIYRKYYKNTMAYFRTFEMTATFQRAGDNILGDLKMLCVLF